MSGIIVLLIYVGLFLGAYVLVKMARTFMSKTTDFTSLKTVTFGDESAVIPDRAASIISVVMIFLVWGAFTDSKLVPIHMPGPFKGETSFTYTSENPAGETAQATVNVIVHEAGEKVEAPEAPAASGFAQGDTATVAEWRSVLIRAQANDGEDAKIVAIEGKPIAAGETVHRMVTCPVNALTIPLFKRCQPPAPPTGLNGHLQITETLDRAVSAVGSVRLVAVGMPPLFRPSHPATRAENAGRICVGFLSDKCRAFSKRLISGQGNLRKTKRTPQEITYKI